MSKFFAIVSLFMYRAFYVALLLVACASAQNLASPSRTIYADVIEKKDQSQVSDLTALNLRVRLDHQPVQVIEARRVVLRPKVVILLDTSGSMLDDKGKWMAALQCARDFVQKLAPGATIMLLPFDDPTRKQALQFGAQQALARLDSMKTAKPYDKTGPRRTALFDTIFDVISTFGLRSEDAVVLVGDGENNAGRVSDKLLDSRLAASGVRLFGIILPDLENYSSMAALVRFGPLAVSTGGAVVSIGSTETISNNVRRQLEDAKLKHVEQWAAYVVARITHPYEIRLAVPADVKGKLKIEALTAKGEKMKKVSIFAPERLHADTAITSSGK